MRTRGARAPVSEPMLLALDLGTTGVRALAVAADGTVRVRAYRPLGISYPAPGWVEQDPGEMWERSLEVLREAVDRLGAGARLEALGVVSQRSTALAWDRGTGEPLAPAIGWQDQRTAARVAELRGLGIPINTLASATKFEWWLREDERVRSAAERGTLCLGTPDAWLGFRLTGGAEHVTDPGQASCTGLYVAGNDGWLPPALQLFGVEEAWLPRIAPTSAPAGGTSRSLFGAALPVAARAGDQQAAAFAQGVHRPGDAKLTLGTSAMLDVHTGGSPAEAPAGAYPLALWQLADTPAAFCLEGTVITAGAAVDWLAAVGLLPDAAALDRVAGEVDSTGGVSFVPALQGLGTPYLDDAARGLVGGLTRGTRSAHIARALVDGIAHRCVDIAEAFGLGDVPLRVDGGLGRSDLLLGTLADLLGRPVLRAAETETTALGAALLAGLATGLFKTPDDCRAVLPPPAQFDPACSPSRRAAARARWTEVLSRCGGRGRDGLVSS